MNQPPMLKAISTFNFFQVFDRHDYSAVPTVGCGAGETTNKEAVLASVGSSIIFAAGYSPNKEFYCAHGGEEEIGIYESRWYRTIRLMEPPSQKLLIEDAMRLFNALNDTMNGNVIFSLGIDSSNMVFNSREDQKFFTDILGMMNFKTSRKYEGEFISIETVGTRELYERWIV